jgi:hypothetical protein
MGYLISSKPFYEPYKNISDVLNELFYYLVLTFCFLFTEFNTDIQLRSSIGYLINSLITFMLIGNFLLRSGFQFKNFYRYTKRAYLIQKAILD